MHDQHDCRLSSARATQLAATFIYIPFRSRYPRQMWPRPTRAPSDFWLGPWQWQSAASDRQTAAFPSHLNGFRIPIWQERKSILRFAQVKRPCGLPNQQKRRPPNTYIIPRVSHVATWSWCYVCSAAFVVWAADVRDESG